ncbi:MAG TPA: hypothetical protein VM513_20465 [Kofleriaceae bacterium]|nr:hypothetical protein [Kofleriaceae bacterium]
MNRLAAVAFLVICAQTGASKRDDLTAVPSCSALPPRAPPAW